MAKSKKQAKGARGKAKAVPARPKKKTKGEAPRPRRTPLSASVIREMRDLLLTQKERVTGDFMNLRQSHLHNSQRDATGDLSGYTLHMADLATDTFDREFALNVVSSEGDIIYLIDQALRRIEDRTYGLCETCGATIKLVRLKAVPWAQLCIKCKKIEETGGGA
ncbi:MAG: TraR/DksA family transcriptional regulator [Candidatus Aureabacteria bacterium]|nr:TraR/DksA family transcriptional regulator [Candidatus Auribacterota bacterium]